MKRLAIVDKKKCNPESCAFLCGKLCPLNRMGEECITLDKKAKINEKLCNGCSICSNRCPFKAISIINLPKALEEDPIHRFGDNEFELFRVPIPKQKTVVGILGRNGIGKSTALEILSAQLKPNLGNYEEETKDKDILKRYSKVVLGDYLKKLFAKNIKISYKPQRIELLPQFYKGKVEELLKKIDQKNASERLLKDLELKQIKQKEISSLSGGELQKLAIIACYVKKADFYFFDEPMSFCDVTSRIKIAKIIRELAKDSAVMVVEHDLATLDFISDEIQILYGQPGAYGVVSQSKAVRRGINEYLDGYLPDDNIRFRDYAIKFSDPIKSTEKAEILLEFPELEKRFMEFTLKVNKGEVNKKQVLAIMGANALGKSTFLKLLAGEEKPTTGEIEKLDISYKPQYIKATNENVLEKLRSVAKTQFSSGWYKSLILEKLDLNRILNQNLKDLSGGELQKVFIALTLSKEAKIYAFDEPSAFVDVEDRLKVAEVIKEFMQKKEACAIVVDHDVQFIDYIADKMIVFEGTPGKEGFMYGPCEKVEGMNRVLKFLDITYRKDKQTNRPRINKPGSQLDVEQRKQNKYYYS